MPGLPRCVLQATNASTTHCDKTVAGSQGMSWNDPHKPSQENPENQSQTLDHSLSTSKNCSCSHRMPLGLWPASPTIKEPIAADMDVAVMMVSYSARKVHSFGCGSKPMVTPGEHQNQWYMGVHPPQNGGIGYDFMTHGHFMTQHPCIVAKS